VNNTFCSLTSSSENEQQTQERIKICGVYRKRGHAHASILRGRGRAVARQLALDVGQTQPFQHRLPLGLELGANRHGLLLACRLRRRSSVICLIRRWRVRCCCRSTFFLRCWETLLPWPPPPLRTPAAVTTPTTTHESPLSNSCFGLLFTD
jgi:hypothetical protein